MTSMFLMIITCWMPAGDKLREAWRSEKIVTAQHCLMMSETFSQGGPAAAITVQCKEIR